MSKSFSLEELQSPTPNWLELPGEVTVMILQKLGTVNILEGAQWVCMEWYHICKDPSMWRSISMGHLPDTKRGKKESMCRNAVDRSCGQLNDINMEFFVDPVGLLRYIVDRAPRLRSLRVVCCILGEGLFEVAKRLPNLEELYMVSNPVATEVLESFGRCCPKLKSLTYNYLSSLPADIQTAGDTEALAIAETMPGLQHLNLFANKMTNVGLQIILNRCPHIESLDLRQCLNIDLESDFGRSCVQRIKNLKLPNDLTDDYEHAKAKYLFDLDDDDDDAYEYVKSKYLFDLDDDGDDDYYHYYY